MSVHEPLRGWCAEPGSPSVVNAGSLPAPTLRVSQLDSALLDDELAFVLRDKFLRVCQHLRMFAAPPHAELAALIRACIAGSAVFGCGASPGGALLGLEFNVTNASARLCRARQVVFGALILARLVGLRASLCGARLLTRLQAEDVHATAATANLVAFLGTGRCRNLHERALGLQLVHSRADVSRIVSLDFLNRQLVWRELGDLLLFLLPLVRGTKFRCLSQLIAKTADGTGADAPRRCPICTRQVSLPFVAIPCGHACCYFCVAASCRAAADNCCPVCQTRITCLRRV